MKYHKIIKLLCIVMMMNSIIGCASILLNPEKVVTISSNPSGANVYIDDIYMGQTPLLVRFTRAFTENEPIIRLTKAEHRNYEGKITQYKNDVSKLNIIPTIGLAALTVAIAENQSNETQYNYKGEAIGSERAAVYFLGTIVTLIGAGIFWFQDEEYKYTYPNKLEYNLTARPSIFELENNTGFEIILENPILKHNDLVTASNRILLANNEKITFEKKSFTDSSEYILDYKSGYKDYRKHINLINDTKLTLNKDDRAPLIIAINNTGNIITQISVTSSDNEKNDFMDILELLPNSQSKNLWFGQVPISLNDKYDFIYTDIFDYTYVSKDIVVSKDSTIIFSEGIIPPSITVLNRTGFAINQIFIRPSNSEEWGTAISSQLILDTQRSSNLMILGGYASSVNRYDIRVEDINNRSYGMFNILITDDITLEFTENQRPQMVRILNNIGAPADRIYLRRTGATSWGFPIVIEVFANGQSQNIQIPFDKWGHDLRYDVRIDNINGVSYTKSNIQIGNDTTLIFTATP